MLGSVLYSTSNNGGGGGGGGGSLCLTGQVQLIMVETCG